MRIPLVPIYNTTFLPGNQIELSLTYKDSIEAIKNSIKNNNYNILTSRIKDNNEIYPIGSLAKIIKINEECNQISIHIMNKTKIFNIKYTDKFLAAQYSILHTKNALIQDKTIKELNQNIIEYSQRNNKDYFNLIYKNLTYMDLLPNLICTNIPIINPLIKQKILECDSVNDQLSLLNNELKEYLKNTTSNKTDDSTIISPVKKIKKIMQKNISIEAKEQIQITLNKINILSPQHPEYYNQIQYINTLTKLPWDKEKHKKYTIKEKKEIINKAQKILDDSHYGINKTKNYILEYLAAYLHTPTSLQNQTLCLIGAPGTGKTSLSYVISKCLSRPHITIAVGGMRDATDLRGHQRTYLSALPGKIINAIITYKTTKLVILLDEIDKLSNAEKNDIYGVIIELLDPSQQHRFLDNYINIPFDISNILFICTANNQAHIPNPIQNRLDIIYVNNYNDSEKIQITQEHLIPKILTKYNLKNKISFENTAIQYIINHYTMEAGIRELNRSIEKIIRKILFIYLNKRTTKTIITTKNIHKYLNNIIYTKNNIIHHTKRIGVINGLAIHANGGKIITIETLLLPEKTNIITATGNLSKVMLESANIAYNHCLFIANKYNVPKKQINDNKIHFHITQGAIEKDGPSAGIAICLAILSNFLQIPIPTNLAITGEISLTGNALEIGGLQTKLITALKANINKIIIPAENSYQLQDIDQEILNKLEIYPIKNVSEAIDIILFPNKNNIYKSVNQTIDSN